MNVLLAAGIALGAGSGSVDPGEAMLGSVTLGFYAVALIGIGVGIGGVWRTSLAAEIVALLVIATFLIDLLAPPLNLPDWVHQLALTAHFGQPMTGTWDWSGIIACLVLLRAAARRRRLGDERGGTSLDRATSRPSVLGGRTA